MTGFPWNRGDVLTADDLNAAFAASGGAGAQSALALATAQATQTLMTPIAWQTGIIIPYYQYVANPYNNAGFSGLITQIRSNPTVPCIVVINQAGVDGLGGPGPYDAAMAQEIRMLQASGAAVAGYVSTQNATRAPALVQADIAAWRTLYPSTPLDAVFFDEVAYDPGVGNANVSLYVSYANMARSNGYRLVIANPGTLQLHVWYDNPVADIYCCYENNSWPTPASFSINPPSYLSGAITDYPVRRFAGLVYSSAWDQNAYTTLLPWLRWIYATDSPSPASGANPWGALPSYLATLFAAAARQTLSAAQLGALDLSSLPTSNPGGGGLWLNSGVLQVGA